MADDLTTMLAAMAASYPDAVVVSGVDGCVRYVNPAAERLLGAPAAGLQGKHVSLLSSPDERLRSRGLAARIVAGEDDRHPVRDGDATRGRVDVLRGGDVVPAGR